MQEEVVPTLRRDQLHFLPKKWSSKFRGCGYAGRGRPDVTSGSAPFFAKRG
jgi:hypothetical protein